MNAAYALRPAWTPLTVLLMVIGFIAFWPLGLAMLAYILWGDRIPEIRRHLEMNGETARQWAGFCGSRARRHGFTASGNAAFDEYRENEFKRLEEERRRLDEELRDFESYLRDLRRARDQEEFDRFKRERAARAQNGPTIDL
jgi:hypothetical protein